MKNRENQKITVLLYFNLIIVNTCIQGVFEKYWDCMLCTSNIYNSNKDFVF